MTRLRDFGPTPGAERVPAPPAARGVLPIILITALLLGVMALATSALIGALRHDGFLDRQRELDNLALTLSEQTARAFQALGLVQTSIIEHVREHDIANRDELAEVMGSREIHQQMREKISGLPYVDAVTLIDETGQLINFSRYWPIPKVNVADRDYFKALSAASGPGVFVSVPVVNRGTGTITIYLARRFDKPGGGFLGLVLGAMEQSYFEKFYGTINLGETGLIALVREDGALLARSPVSAAVGTHDAPRRAHRVSQLFASNGAGDGYVDAGVLDGEARIAAVQRLPDYPLAVVVSDSVASLSARLWRRALPILVAAGLLCLAICLIAYFVAHQILAERAFAKTQHFMARHDPLTGLPNRLSFAERLEELLHGPAPVPFALYFLDLDYFKSVNDTLGHDVGDALLRAVGARLKEQVADGGVVVRLGGDEFAVLRPRVESDAGAFALAQTIIDLVREPFVIGLHQIVAGCSVGIAMAPRDGNKVAGLLKNADLALYQAKSDGRGVARMFERELERSAVERHALEADLNDAWTARQLTLAYQPIFEAQSGRLAGFEALVRWHHPGRGVVPAETFVPLAEETGLILPIGAFVLEEACRAATSWPAHLFVSVNLSPIQFRGAHAFGQVRTALERSGLPPSRLELEITESVLLQEGASVRAALDLFRAEGIALVLDDFGTGYSSLRYLRMLNIARIKVDRAFIDKMEVDDHNLAIVRAILSLAQALSLKSTAEGIETEEQLRLVKAEGCTHVQGFLLGYPMSAQEALQLARSAAA